ncbi:head GIN domain-containing protein [Sediminitomix flava]|uniref:Putative autotransporter adhesin-like protein n=1 Tax=Sediminitomix flava TaxID=379075 RepID=A0A315ZH82_SEDFL|nr:head GIN domain-containing protein [Sediminitomix flava]PWJ44500.1 putative autotransporter adhesin-like protein [Sediminitomix flava]
MKNTYLKTVFVLALSFLSASLFAQDIKKDLPNFSALKVSGAFDVILKQGNKTAVEVQLKGSTKAEDIEIEVEGESLKIRPNPKVRSWYNSSPSATIYVYFKNLENISSSGSSDVTSRDVVKADELKIASSGSSDIKLPIEVNELDLSASGSTDIYLSGNVKNDAEMSLSGSCDVGTYDLILNNLEINMSGSCDAKLTINGELEARISGSGDISYKGEPTTQSVKISGSGDIHKVM